MTSKPRPRILIVDDEEAILETMSFTFMDLYEVLTSDDAKKALELLDEHAPVSVVITDQRMPGMTGVELLQRVYEQHPETIRIMLTGFADSDATISAINEGHIYAYISKPWEPDELKQTVRRAIEHYDLAVLNRKLMKDLRSANSIMEAVMDRLDVGAVAIDRGGIVRAANQPARDYLGLGADPRGHSLDGILEGCGLTDLYAVITRVAEEHGGSFEDHDLRLGGKGHFVRVSTQQLNGADNEPLGRVVLFKEISHEPLRRSFEEIVHETGRSEDDLRQQLEGALSQLKELAGVVKESGVASRSMAELDERVSRSRTAIQNWLAVDDVMATEDYPDAQLLLDRMRVAGQRWPSPEQKPKRIEQLEALVEAYYESGENPRRRVL